MLTTLLQSMMQDPLQELLNVVAASQKSEYDTQVAELHSEIQTRKSQGKMVASKYEDCYSRLCTAVSEMKSRAKMIVKYEQAVKECKIKEVSLTEEVTSLQMKLQESEVRKKYFQSNTNMHQHLLFVVFTQHCMSFLSLWDQFKGANGK
jgi:flagellar biosynthesis chaperone FliJ